ncbi:GLE1-like protein-domain-containing protein [Irpex rosettiformis]|uniref:GLE1-like protein-domain-containing protein n=1 Tax=Irpex rosettiformis TaxID=378272 RepID=A0ACB8U8N9_9APHY|nr:GLE1-like protein-domain-containing protein [Irpex rosettiformis]
MRGRGNNVSEQHNLEDMLASIRLRVAHHDVYEEWEQQTRKDAFVSARREQAALREDREHRVETAQIQKANSQTALHQRQLQDVQSKLSQWKRIQQEHEQKERAGKDAKNRQLWQRIEGVIKLEEGRARAKQEAEQRKREDEEKKRRDIEQREKDEQERKLKEELQKRKEAEEEKQQKEQLKAKEDEDQRRQKEDETRQKEDEARQKEDEARKAAQDQAVDEAMKSIGASTAAEDWQKGHDLLKRLKDGAMKTVKSDKQMKSVWSAGRRKITPKIGQLTNDPESIKRITQQLIEVVKPPVPHPRPIYFALLSSLSKAILLQAETEVTAEKRSAIPLSQVTANLLGSVELFCDIFWAKLCQRAGGWPVPYAIPPNNVDNTPSDLAARRKLLGYRENENAAAYSTRVAGVMRVYFHVMAVPIESIVDPRFRLPRYWTFFARILQQPQLLEAPVGPEVIFTALDVAGASAREIWGAQWVKLLSVLYEGATTGLFGEQGRLIGGKSAEGIAARVRVQLEIERIMGTLQ